jgi:hypothetical protein
MFDGLFFSKLKDGFLEPQFGFAVYEQMDKTVTKDSQPLGAAAL